ncbi:hypothetical protein [Microbacterium sp. LWH3-1.2]|uniref:hypothetical protein n=1 Tax=Microbacterium sp. LWH3-1.2 TaxID=3135256 RepID=UPI00344AE3E2
MVGRLLLEDPDAIRRPPGVPPTRRAVAITSSYQVSHTGLAAAGFDRADGSEYTGAYVQTVDEVQE